MRGEVWARQIAGSPKITTTHGGAVGSMRMPARSGFSPLAAGVDSALSLVVMREGYHEATCARDDLRLTCAPDDRAYVRTG